MRKLLVPALLLIGTPLAGTLAAQEVTYQRLLNADKEPHNWLSYYRTYNGQRYSPLDQITKSNVRRLVPVWAFQTGDVEGGLQTTPLVADGVMYLSTAWNRIFALDAVTGRRLWQYNYEKPKKVAALYSPWNRGVALANGLVFMGTIDNHMLAIDAKTGREVWNVEVEDPEQCGCNITGAPLVVKDKVLAGVTGGDAFHRGYINAFDLKTGRQAWRFWTIPGPGEPGNETWSGDSWKYGGGSAWTTGSFDPDLNLVYWSIGNPAADFYGQNRKGKNLYTDSIVALDADTGKLKWYNQQIPNDVWDFDTAYENVLIDVNYQGRPRKLLVNVSKSGFTWVLDRTNGNFISAWPAIENYNFIKGIDKEGNLLGRNEPAPETPTLICPAIAGGRSWNHAAFNPKNGWFFTTGLEWCMEMISRQETPKEGQAAFGGEFKMKPPPLGPPGGHLGAYDPITGRVHWMYKSKYPLLASQLVTAGGLMFTGDAEGKFFALDADTGKELWGFMTGSGNRGSPISYGVKGRQYIATPTGWGSALAGLMPQLWPETENFRPGSAVFVFALPEN
jgi:alcohol dehydrogenase (cytochrome c)